MGKYYLSADLEGMTGVTSLPQCYPAADKTGYQRAVEQLVLELTWVMAQIRLLDPQAQFWVNDAHNTMTNVPWGQLPDDVGFIGGKPKPCAMMAGLDSSFDAALLLGYHGMAGTVTGNLAHTFHHKIRSVSINQMALGEGGVNALYAQACYGVPVILASGDRALCQELQGSVPGLYTVETKVGLSLTAASCHPWGQVKTAYQQALAQCFHNQKSWNKPKMDIVAPYTLEINFTDALCADIVSVSPLYQRVDGTTVSFASACMETVYRALQSAYMMLAYARHLEE